MTKDSSARKVLVGVIGCGTISETYLKNMTAQFGNLTVYACADIVPEKAASASEKFGIPVACGVDELLAIQDIGLVVNLTIPAAHHEINMKALKAGKHVYCEKPLALSLKDAREQARLAEERGLILASAPDTFLGAGIQTCRKLIDDGAIGKPVAFTANMCSPGMDLWHPAPSFYYKKGAGPMWDMGPYYLTALINLLGPIKKISCFSAISRPQRRFYDETWVDVEVATTYAGIMEFRNGVIGNINMSFDMWKSKMPLIEIHGTKGSLGVPDPNTFNGAVTLCDGNKLEQDVRAVEGSYINRITKLTQRSEELNTEIPLLLPAEEQPQSNMRGLGSSEIAQAILYGRKCRLNANLSTHVVEALEAFDISSNEGKTYIMTTDCERPEPLPSDLKLWQME